MTELADIEVQTIDGETRTLRDHAGKVLLVVNVASRCGFTPQYAGLEALLPALSGRAASRCWAFPATSSAIRSRATRPKSRTSAR